MNELRKKVLEKFEASGDPDALKRFNHVESVAKRALEIISENKLYVDPKKAEISALVHDYAKFLTKDEFSKIVMEFNLDENIMKNNYKLLHAFLGPYVIKKELGIDDLEILEAVQFHTTGKPNMTPLQEVIFLADFTEELREDADVIRKVSKRNYKRAIALIMDLKINKTIANGSKVHELTLKAIEDYKKYLDINLEKVSEVIDNLDHNLVTDIKIYDARNNTPHYDYVIITTAPSKRQMEAAASYLKSAFPIRTVEVGDFWILVDLKDVVVHIFLEEERDKYGLDKLLKDVPEIELN